MALNYAQKNPRSILRDYLVDPSPALKKGYAHPKIFGIPQMGEGAVASGRAVDLGDSRILNGTLLVRSQRDLLASAADRSAVAQKPGDPRDLVEGFALDQINFDMEQFSAFTREKIANIENGFSEDEERHMAAMVADSVCKKIELYCSDFFTALAAESATASTTGRWTELDWQGATIGGNAIGTSTNAISSLHRAVMATKLAAGGSDINFMCMGQGVFERLQRDAELLGRIINGSNYAVQGEAVAPPSVAMEVLKQHLGIDEIVVASAAQADVKRGASWTPASDNSYLWPSDRIFIGNAGSMDVSVRNADRPRVLNDAGCFGAFYSKVYETDIGYEAKVGPQFLECAVDTWLSMVALVPQKGAIIHNMD